MGTGERSVGDDPIHFHVPVRYRCLRPKQTSPFLGTKLKWQKKIKENHDDNSLYLRAMIFFFFFGG